MLFIPISRPKTLNTLLLFQGLLILVLFSFFTTHLSVHDAHAQKRGKTEQAKRVIVVKDYKWASGGMGRPGIMSEITLENRGKMDYRNIDIEVDFYTTNDIPLGSLRSTIHELLPAGSEQTFYNLKFGLMHSELKNSVARVAGAEVIEKGKPSLAKDLIVVKNWEWSGGQYGTEGIIKELTLVNKSSENWKDIKIRVDFLGLSGGKVGIRGFTSRAIIHDILPARSERTYKNINIGFRHPEARKVSISVMSAKPISEKEVKYKQAKKEGKSVTKVKKRKSPDGAEVYADDTEYRSPEGKKLSLSQRYKKKLDKEQGAAWESRDDATGAQESPDAPGGTGEVALSERRDEKTISVREAMTIPQKADSQDTRTAEAEDGDFDYEYDEEVPLPQDDIVVEDFVWGGGVAQTIGVIREITLQNISGISYTKIDLKIDFFSYKEETPMFSNRVTIFEVLPANSKKTFKNIKAGFLNTIPQEVRIEVLGAIPFSQY